MSKVNGLRMDMQETDDYRFGYESADRGEPMPSWFVAVGDHENRIRLSMQIMGWQDWHDENGQFGVGA